MALTEARRWIGWLLLGTAFCGCNYLPGGGSDVDADFADLELDDDVEPDSIAQKPKRRSLLDEIDEAETPEEPVAKGELGLHLAVGDQFPLRKTLEQRLTQPGQAGPVTGASRVDLLMSLRVEELREGHTRLGVRYHSVRYREQDLEGRKIEYDSTQPMGEIPPQALVYAGLVNNGFSFWIGPDNRLVDLVGFKDFVQRCVQNVPSALRQTVVSQLSAASGENGIASFIDDSIGLLPVGAADSRSGVAVKEGTTWDLPLRKLDGPVPMQVATRCMIKGLTEKTAEIDLFGTIAAGQQTDPQHGWKISILGGRCLGSCTVDRRTGIPTNSVVQRYVDLVWQLPDGSELKQRKEIITTVTAYLNQDAQLTRFDAGPVAPASHQVPSGPDQTGESAAASPPRRGISDAPPIFR